MIINGHNLPDRADILGVEYKIIYETEQDNVKMEGNDGFCEKAAKELHIDRSFFEKNDGKEKYLKDLKLYGNEVLRHEAIHAFVEESGLGSYSPWATDEAFVQWLSKQFPKMSRCFKAMGIEE